MKVEGVDTELALAMAKKGIKTLEELAEQAIDDLTDLNIDAQRAGDIIMGARNLTWFKEENAQGDSSASDAEQ